VKIWGGVGEISIPTVKALPTTEPAWLLSVVIDKKKQKKSSWVKLKVFPNLLAGRPNNSSYSTKIARQFTVNGARNATSFSKVITERLLKTATSVHSSVNQL